MARDSKKRVFHLLVFSSFLFFVSCSWLSSSKKGKPKKAEKEKEPWRLEWSDGFEHMDVQRWTARDDSTGTGVTGFDPAHVSIDNGHIVLKLDKQNYNGKPYAGAELASTRDILFGKIEVKMRPPKGKSAVCALLSSSSVSNTLRAHDEIGVQFKGSETRSVYFNYFRRKQQPENGNSYILPFDAAEEFHVYTIEWNKKRIRWFIDGKLYYEADEHIPQSAQKITFSIWSKTAPAAVAADEAKDLPALLLVDYVKYYSKNN